MVLKKAVGIAVLVALMTQPALARKSLEPEYYRFTYKYENNRIINNSVCNEYNRTSTDWMKCRLYAKWWFGKECRDNRAKAIHWNPTTQRYKQWKMFCAAAQDINASR